MHTPETRPNGGRLRRRLAAIATAAAVAVGAAAWSAEGGALTPTAIAALAYRLL